MKKLVVSFLFGITCMVSYGQFTQGTIMVGGSFGADFDTEKTKTGNTTTVTGHTTSIDIAPSAGYFVIDNVAVGAAIDMYASKYKSKDGLSTNSSNSVSFAPFARYYYQKFYGQGSFQLGTEKTKYVFDGNTTNTTSNISGWSLAVGYAYLLNQNVALEPQIGFQSNGYKTGNDKDITSGLFLRIGFQIYLTKQP